MMSAHVQKEGFRGYCNHNEFDGKRIPVPIQNLIMRDYAHRRSLLFKLSANEFNFPNCYVQFMNMLKQLSSLEGVIMCSLFMLPEKKDVRLKAYEAFIEQGTELHMVLENEVIRKPEDIEKVEAIIQISETLKACPTSIPSDLLPHGEVGFFR